MGLVRVGVNEMLKFNVTYEAITKESAEQGDADSRGFLCQDESFRFAFDLWRQEASGGYCEADSYPISAVFPPRWLTIGGDMHWLTGEYRNVSLHFPRGITPSSAMRIARLAGAYGAP